MNPNERGRQLIDVLLCGKDREAVRLLKQHEDFDFTIVNKGDNAIHLAARHGSARVIKYMRRHGADIQQKNVHGNVAMHYAARGGYLDLVRYLIRKGADPNSLNDDGESPLHEAVKTQTMDIIEALVDLGMDPNIKNSKSGETPLHTALRYGAEEAMEGLLIKGATTHVKNKEGKGPEDVAKNKYIKGSLCMYATMLMAVSAGYIKAKGMKITHRDVARPFKVDRVGIVIESIDIPKEFPAGFYCRREMTENSSVSLRQFDEESTYSDVFHIRIFDVKRECTAKIHLPLYKSPSEKEELVIRFIHSALNAHIGVKWETTNQVHYCLLETILVPETTCICIVNARPKKESNKVTDAGATITSAMDNNFLMEVPPGSFHEETVLSLKVFETNDEVEMEEETDVIDNEIRQDLTHNKNPRKSESLERNKIDESLMEGNETAEEQLVDDLHDVTEEQNSTPSTQKYNLDLLTDIYQVNVAGQQPTKGIKMQIPLWNGLESGEELTIISANEETLNDENKEDVLEVLPVSPQIVGGNIIFEVSHFSIYVASWKKKALVKEDLREIQKQILNVRERRKPAAFFAVVKLVEGRKHILVVECVMASRSLEHRRKWLESENYEEQNPPETGAIMMTPGETFCVDIEGNASFEDSENAKERKLQFSQCRSSWQPYHLMLHEGIYDEDNAYAHIKILKKSNNGLDEAARLRIKLTPPPPPPPPTPPPPPKLSTPPPSPPPIPTEAELYPDPEPEPVVRPKQRPKTAVATPSPSRPPRPSSAQLTLRERLSEVVNRINKKDYRPERTVGEAMLSFLRRRSTTN